MLAVSRMLLLIFHCRAHEKNTVALALSLSITLPAFATPPSTFTEAKIVAKQKVYLDRKRMPNSPCVSQAGIH